MLEREPFRYTIFPVGSGLDHDFGWIEKKMARCQSLIPDEKAVVTRLRQRYEVVQTDKVNRPAQSSKPCGLIQSSDKVC